MALHTINEKFSARGRARGRPSRRVEAVAEMFGLGLDERDEVRLYDGLAVDVRPGDVVFLTGPSGCGKSAGLRRLVASLRAAEARARIVNLADIEPPPRKRVVDGFGLPLDETLYLASTAGLADAFVLLRRPGELSEGQRWRLRLAHALAALGLADVEADAAPPEAWRVLVADELASTLDRLCARAVAYRLRRLADRRNLTILAACAHDDILDDLAPDVLVVKAAGTAADVYYADPDRETGRERAR